MMLCTMYMASNAQAKWDPTTGQWVGYNPTVGLGPGTLSGNWYNGGSYLMPGTLTPMPMPNRNQNWNQGWWGNPMMNYNPYAGGFVDPYGRVIMTTPPINGYGNQWGSGGNLYFNIGAGFHF